MNYTFVSILAQRRQDSNPGPSGYEFESQLRAKHAGYVCLSAAHAVPETYSSELSVEQSDNASRHVTVQKPLLYSARFLAALTAPSNVRLVTT
jgi:hypothetical protein